MNVSRGDVVLIDYPYASGTGAKVRPVLVVQNDQDNRRLTNTIVIQITTTKRPLEKTQVLVSVNTSEGKATGLLQDSVVNCANVVTVDKNKILRRLGAMSGSLMQLVSQSLKVAFDLP